MEDPKHKIGDVVVCIKWKTPEQAVIEKAKFFTRIVYGNDESTWSYLLSEGGWVEEKDIMEIK